ncbi:MAG: hypothetical protein A2X84_14360 [Desulfuromonadaceae bacterium GWC2_58_13]|nr:MAG: hypothetical protein A2X84_14360 [Desulfuromonadaceae bacterium GWC2_58_13]
MEKVMFLRSPLAYYPHIGHEDPHPPLELLYLAAALKPAYEVKILDGQRQWRRHGDFGHLRRLGLSDEDLIRETVEFGPDMIALSVTWHHQIPTALYCANLLKKHLPEVTIVAGGIAPSSSPEVLLESGRIDFVIAGDGERSLLQLCRALSGEVSFGEVPGLKFLEGDRVISVPKQNFLQLDEVPFPAFELIDLADYDGGYQHGHHKASPMAGVLPTRGCPLDCHFCSLPAVSDKLFRTHSVERVVDDMLRMRDEFGIREIHFYDDNLINNTAFAKALFRRMIEQNVGLHWLPEAGFAMWQIDQEILDLATASGMYRLDLPIEAASGKVREEIMNKGLYQNSQVAETLRRARRAGVEKINGYVIVGSPGESLEDIKGTLDFLADLDLDYRGVRLAQPFPGTRFYQICVEQGLLRDDFSLDRLWFTMSNIETNEFSSSQLVALVVSYRAAAMIRQGVRTIESAVKEIAEKHGAEIARTASGFIPEVAQRYEQRRLS